MTHRILFLTRLRDGVDPANYERFVRDVELSVVENMSSVRSYSVVRLLGLVEEGNEPMLPYQYADLVETESVAAYREDLARLPDTTQGRAFEAEWQSYVAEWKSVYGEVVGETSAPG